MAELNIHYMGTYQDFDMQKEELSKIKKFLYGQNSSQVDFFCRLTALIVNLNWVEWLKSVSKYYLWHLKPNLNDL